MPADILADNVLRTVYIVKCINIFGNHSYLSTNLNNRCTTSFKKARIFNRHSDVQSCLNQIGNQLDSPRIVPVTIVDTEAYNDHVNYND